jgi:hypothetical protein
MPEASNEIQDYMDLPLDSLLEELALYREQATGGPVRSPADAWGKLVPRLRQRVCADWNWCQRRQDARFDEPAALAALVAEIVTPDAVSWSIPAALIAVILVKKGLDAFCNCPPIGFK